MTPGRFISLEGGEGVGKSTQAVLLAEALGARGIETIVTREPGGSEGAEAIRALLLEGGVGRWSAHSEALLFAAARGDHVEKRIRPAIDAGCWVICDRFIDSARAYQGAQGIDDAAILALHGFGSKGLLPDRTFILQIHPDRGTARALARDAGALDRFGKRGFAFHAEVADGFRRIAEHDRDRIREVNADGDPAAVTDRLMAELIDLLP